MAYPLGIFPAVSVFLLGRSVAIPARHSRAQGHRLAQSAVLVGHGHTLSFHAYPAGLLRRAHVFHTPPAASGAASPGAPAYHGRLPRTGVAGGLADALAGSPA